MTTLKDNRCYDCGKVFCCSDCRSEHVTKKHPTRAVACALCRSDVLAVKNFDDQEFLYHVFFNHLPLYCIICGLEFKNCEELQSIGLCNRRTIIDLVEKRKTLFSPATPSSLVKTPCGSTCIKGTKSSTIEGDYNGNFGNFVSPPEFTRHTSTPMNVAALKADIVFKTPKSPLNHTIKTPKIANKTTIRETRTNETSAADKENGLTSYKGIEICDESNYYSFSASTTSTGLSDRTPLRSILSNRSSGNSDNSSYLTRSNINGRKMLDAMDEIDENFMNNIDNELFTSESSQTTTNGNRDKLQKDSAKRVRFSDQFEMKTEIEKLSNEIDSMDNEEFYEARQSISDMSMALMEKLSLSSARIHDENEKNYEKENKKEDSDGSNKTPDPETIVKNTQFLDSKIQNEASSSSSRVIMMVVVEKSGNINTTELAPLIDSSLKKLVSTSGENFGNSIDISKRDNDATKPGTSVLSVDSYMSVSTVECYKTPDSTINATRNSRESTESSNSASSSGGIFAAVAHAMKTAFKNLSGVKLSRNATREPVKQGENSSMPSLMAESTGASSKVLTSLASALVPRTPKRSRDSDELTSSHSPDNGDIANDVRSPVPKRPRGWYKIRAREPIARMRNCVTLPSGIPSETQCVQQDLLSIGDTILNLPSRVHQSTQTD